VNEKSRQVEKDIPFVTSVPSQTINAKSPEMVAASRKAEINDTKQIKEGKTIEETISKQTEIEIKRSKYAHLPVYDKDEEQRMAQERKENMSKLFNDVNKNLDSITDLTSTHMANKGYKMAPTPFDDESAENVNQNVHTIHYNKGVLKPRNSAASDPRRRDKVGLQTKFLKSTNKNCCRRDINKAREQTSC